MTGREKVACYAAVMQSGCTESNCFNTCDTIESKEAAEPAAVKEASKMTREDTVACYAALFEAGCVGETCNHVCEDEEES